MDAVVMAGGKGERMGQGEKPMAMLEGRPMVAYVVRALLGSRNICNVYVAVSHHTPLTAEYIKGCPDKRVSPVMTPGSGYVVDTVYAARVMGLYEPFLVVSADLPLITSDVIDEVVSEYAKCGKEALSVRMEANVTAGGHDTILTDSGKPTIPAGINVVHGAHLERAQDEYVLILNDPVLAVNVNYRKDLTYCAHLMATMRDHGRLP